MLRSIYWYIHFMISAALQTPAMLHLRKNRGRMAVSDFDAQVEKVTSRWAMAQIKASGSSLQITGLEHVPPDEPVLFVSNHQSNFDIAFFMAYIRKPKGFVAKLETLKIPLIRTWMRYMHCLFMDRNDIKQSAKTIFEGVDELKAGHSLVIFPEGTRSKGGPMGEFKPGSFKLATKSKVKLIPVTINGSYRIMEQNRNRIKPSTATMIIHPPIDVKTLTKDELAELPKRVESIIKSAL